MTKLVRWILNLIEKFLQSNLNRTFPITFPLYVCPGDALVFPTKYKYIFKEAKKFQTQEELVEYLARSR